MFKRHWSLGTPTFLENICSEYFLSPVKLEIKALRSLERVKERTVKLSSEEEWTIPTITLKAANVLKKLGLIVDIPEKNDAVEEAEEVEETKKQRRALKQRSWNKASYRTI